jgi:ADP-ribose pyrophosphatase YjhB (NUDIX family)
MLDKPTKLRNRASAVILKDGKILLIKRTKPEREYFIFPGGGVDKGENFEEAVRREVKEELCLDVQKCHFIFSIENLGVPVFITIHAGNRNEHYFFIDEYIGNPEIGGPEKERATGQNQYHITWLSMEEFAKQPNIFPREGVKGLIDFFQEAKFIAERGI